MKKISVCIFCGSRQGNDKKWIMYANQIGKLIGKKKWSIIFGGGEWGIMGEVAGAASKYGSEVTGVITEDLARIEPTMGNLKKLITVKTLTQRKAKMSSMSDVFLVLPGGIGTMDELFEVWAMNQLNIHNKPVILANLSNFFDNFLFFIEDMANDGFLNKNYKQKLKICLSIDEIFKELNLVNEKVISK